MHFINFWQWHGSITIPHARLPWNNCFRVSVTHLLMSQMNAVLMPLILSLNFTISALLSCNNSYKLLQAVTTVKISFSFSVIQLSSLNIATLPVFVSCFAESKLLSKLGTYSTPFTKIVLDFPFWKQFR